MKKGSVKNNRINGEVMRALSVIIRDGVKDPRIDPMLSITKVEVTPDLQFCKVHVSTISGGDSLERSIEGLSRAEGYIRRELAHTVNLRKTPELQFVPDRSIEYAVEMSKKIDELLRTEGQGALNQAESFDQVPDQEPKAEEGQGYGSEQKDGI